MRASFLLSCLFAGEIIAATIKNSHLRLEPRTYDLGKPKFSNPDDGAGPSTSRSVPATEAEMQSSQDRIKVSTGRKSYDDLNRSSSSSDSSSGWSSGLSTTDSTPESSPRASSNARTPLIQGPKPGQPFGLTSKFESMSLLPTKKAQIKTGGQPISPELQGFKNGNPDMMKKVKDEEMALQKYINDKGSGKDAKGRATVLGIGKIEATSDFYLTAVDSVGPGQASQWSLRHHNMVDIGGSTFGGFAKAKMRGDTVSMRLETGKTGKGWYEDRRNPDVKHRKIYVGPNERIQETFSGTRDQPAKVRVKAITSGLARVVGINHPYQEDPPSPKQKKKDESQPAAKGGGIIQGGVQKYRKPK